MALYPTLIVFDCDGTLADSQHVIVEAMRLAFEDANLAAPGRLAILRTVGLSVPEAIKVLAPEQFPENRNELACAFRDHCATLRRPPNGQEPLFPGAASLLAKLAAEENMVLGIATGKSRRGVLRFIEENGLYGIFSTIQTASDAPSKPHPAMLLQAMEETGASPDTTVMIGDTSYDMIMAACANADAIGVTWGYHTPEDLKMAGARVVVSSFPALERALHTRQTAAQHVEAVA
jgi:phosphoglycolate phosphatase